jgi:hypothetical protein
MVCPLATLGSTYERNTATLRQAAQQQPDTLTGRVAASELAEAARDNEASTPDTYAEARRLNALSVADRIATARARNAQRKVGREPGHEV